MARKKLTAKLHKSEVMVVDRSAIKKKRLVYFLVADRSWKYKWGRSPILYIGTTAKGVARVARSAAYRAKTIFGMHGIKKFGVRVVSCPKRPGLPTWKVLEKDLLRRFKAKYGEVPTLNGWKNLNPHHLSGYFSERNLYRILAKF